MSPSVPEFEIPHTPELSSASSSGSSSGGCSSFSALFVASEADLDKDAAVPLPKARPKFDGGLPLQRNRNITPSLDTLLRDLPPLDMSILGPKLSTSPLTSILVTSPNSRVPMPNGRSFPAKQSHGVIRRASDKGPTGTVERQRYVSVLSLPSTPFSRQDAPRDQRTIKFMSPRSPTPRFRKPQSPHPNRLTIQANTDALARLAWTGEFLSPSNDASRSVEQTILRPRIDLERHSSWRSTWSSPHDGSEGFNGSPLELESESISPVLPDSPRPILFRRCRSPSRHKRRRWTLALAITDEQLTDEALMDELEKMRRRDRVWEWEWRRNADSPLSPLPHVESPSGENDNAHYQVVQMGPWLPSPLDLPLNSRWKAARHALLICRELVRTERHYLSSLYVLQAKETLTMPPALMMTYLPALIQSSLAFLASLERNPSAKGVADAFVANQAAIEQALIGWCGVVGSFFIGADENEGASRNEVASLKTRVGSWGKRMKSLRSNSHTASNAASIGMMHVRRKRKPRVRELAILPTQRVGRYVLLYKDLLAHTPSPLASREIVEQALQSAILITQKCDRAQQNSSLLLPS